MEKCRETLLLSNEIQMVSDVILLFSGQKQASKCKPKLRRQFRLKWKCLPFLMKSLEGKYGDAPESFYAYIDPANERSKWISGNNLDFRTETQLITQSFSRTKASFCAFSD